MLMKAFFSFKILSQNCCENMKKIKTCTGAVKVEKYIYTVYAVVFLLSVLFLFLQRCMGRIQRFSLPLVVVCH